MKQEVNPNETPRARAFELWMKSPQPMVTLTKTFDVTHLRKAARRRHLKFNMLLCWCIGKASSETEQFYLLPEKGTLYRYDRLAINVIVSNAKGGINSCDIPYSESVEQFNADYLRLTRQVADSCVSHYLDDHMIVGTSAMIGTELDSAVNQYSELFLNPMMAWGRYRRRWCRTLLPISLQFHHVQMDGGLAVRFFERLQEAVRQC